MRCIILLPVGYVVPDFEEDLENYQNFLWLEAMVACLHFKGSLCCIGDGKQATHGGTCWESVMALQLRDFDGLEEGGKVEMDTCK